MSTRPSFMTTVATAAPPSKENVSPLTVNPVPDVDVQLGGVHAYLGELESGLVHADDVAVRADARGHGDGHLVAAICFAFGVFGGVDHADLAFVAPVMMPLRSMVTRCCPKYHPFTTLDDAVQGSELRGDGLAARRLSGSSRGPELICVTSPPTTTEQVSV